MPNNWLNSFNSRVLLRTRWSLSQVTLWISLIGLIQLYFNDLVCRRMMIWQFDQSLNLVFNKLSTEKAVIVIITLVKLLPITRNFFGTPRRACTEQSRNIWQIKGELTKHMESSPKELWEQYFNVLFYFSHCEIHDSLHLTIVKEMTSLLHWGNSSSSWWSHTES